MVNLARLIVESGAFKTGTFTLASGETSDYYVDMKLACADPALLNTLAQHGALYAIGHDALAGTALGGVPFAVALGLETGRSTFLVRGKSKEHGTQSRVEGPVDGTERVLLVEDVVTTGGSLLDAVDAVREMGCTVEHAITIVDRQQGARELLRENDVALHALITLTELRDHARTGDEQ